MAGGLWPVSFSGLHKSGGRYKDGGITSSLLFSGQLRPGIHLFIS